MIEQGFAAYLPWRKAIGEVLDERRHTLEWLDGQITTGRATAWIADDAAIVTEIRAYPTGARELHGLVAVGALETIRDALIPAAEKYARSIGCIGAVIESREGWRRVMSASGYEVYQVALRKEFAHGAE